MSTGAGGLQGCYELAQDGVDAGEFLAEGVELSLQAVGAGDQGAGYVDGGVASELGEILAAVDAAGGTDGIVFLLTNAELDHAGAGAGNREFGHGLKGEGEGGATGERSDSALAMRVTSQEGF